MGVYCSTIKLFSDTSNELKVGSLFSDTSNEFKVGSH